MFNNYIILTEICLIDSLILLLCICFGKIDVYRHERTVLLDHFTHTVLIGKLQALLIKEKCDLSSWFCLVSICHLIFCTTVTGPVNRCRSFFIRKRIDVYLIRNHKRGIKSKSEMTDHLIICCLILIFLKKFCCTGKSDLCNIFLYLICSHTDTIINKLQGFLIWIYDNIHCRFIAIRECIITHNFQFSQFGDCVTSIGDHFSYKNVMIGV